jgi:hypothetical protein
MSGAPTHTIWHIRDREGKKGYWTEIGVGFTNRDGSITLKLNLMPMDGARSRSKRSIRATLGVAKTTRTADRACRAFWIQHRMGLPLAVPAGSLRGSRPVWRRPGRLMAFSRSDKTFGEVKRVRSDGTVANADDLPSKRTSNSPYERYKQELNSFFTGGKPLPTHLRDMLATRPGASDHGFEEGTPDAVKAEAADDKETKKPKKADRRVLNAPTDERVVLEEALRRSGSPREVQTAIDALRSKGFSLPRDAEMLGKALSHPDDVVLEQALESLVELHREGSLKSNTLLRTRLKNVLLFTSSRQVSSLCEQLQVALA